MHQLIHFFQRNGFNVLSRISDRLGISVSNLRLFFIYISFITLGVSFLAYLTIAFFLKLKDLIYTKRKSVFDL